MEKIMSETNETFGDHDTLADSELDAVAGAAKSNSLAAREDALLAAILQAAATMLPKT
jgi:hypothetical protein